MTVEAVYSEPMSNSGYTRVMIYMGLSLTTYETAPGYRSCRHNRLRGLVAPSYLDRSL